MIIRIKWLQLGPHLEHSSSGTLTNPKVRDCFHCLACSKSTANLLFAARSTTTLLLCSPLRPTCFGCISGRFYDSCCKRVLHVDGSQVEHSLLGVSSLWRICRFGVLGHKSQGAHPAVCIACLRVGRGRGKQETAVWGEGKGSRPDTQTDTHTHSYTHRHICAHNYTNVDLSWVTLDDAFAFVYWLQIWDIKRKGCIQTYKGHADAINCLRFSPDGHWVVSGSDDGLIKLWDLTAGKLITEFREHRGAITSLEFHPNEFLLASGSADRLADLHLLVSLCILVCPCVSLCQGGFQYALNSLNVHVCMPVPVCLCAP